MDGLGQDVPATMKRCPARCVTQPLGRQRSRLKKRLRHFLHPIASLYCSITLHVRVHSRLNFLRRARQECRASLGRTNLFGVVRRR